MESVRKSRQPLGGWAYAPAEEEESHYEKEMRRLQGELSHVSAALSEAAHAAHALRGRFIRNTEDHRQAYVNLAGLTQRYKGGVVRSRGDHCNPSAPIELAAGTYDAILESGAHLEGQPCRIYEGSVIRTTIRRGNRVTRLSAYVDRNGVKHEISNSVPVGTSCGVVEVPPSVYTAIPDGPPLESVPHCHEDTDTPTMRHLRARAGAIMDEISALSQSVAVARSNLQDRQVDLRNQIDTEHSLLGQALEDTANSRAALRSSLSRSETVAGQQQSSRLRMASRRAHYLVWAAVAILCIVLTIRYAAGGGTNALTSGVIVIGCVAAIWIGAKELSDRYFR